MKKILLSIMAIALVATAGIYSTRAYFTDTEVSTGNEIQAGTIDISVDGENPWSRTYTENWTDFKPGVTKEMTFVVRNEGANPVVLRKMLENFVASTGSQTEPECAAELGSWGEGCTGMTAEDNDLSKVMIYSMTVTPEGGSPIVVLPESLGKTMANVEDLWFPLGTIEPGQTLTVTQSYKMSPDAGNQYQGDTLTFDIKLFAEQRLGLGVDTSNGVVVDNKTGDPDWYSMVDGTFGVLNKTGATDYTFNGYGLEAGATYRLVYSVDPYGSFTQLASGVATGGTITLSGSNLPLSLTGKVWLLYGSSGWGNNLKNLWEVNLISY
ncbi:MAG: TasA family protein [Microgenomates group bacterium]|jgi:predicted ribosomally synthesized peptide with SipW-like signal peptide